uniref:Uncharacterized protein n=1 Tax=viral metagenome TaxID=1070528 RepID=A0A6C0H586_9ZZZZ
MVILLEEKKAFDKTEFSQIPSVGFLKVKHVFAGILSFMENKIFVSG